MKKTYNLGQALLQIQKMDIGEAKKSRLRGYVRRQLKKINQETIEIDLEQLSQLSRRQLVES